MLEIPVRQKRYSLEEYFALEEKATEKHEYHNGKIKTMAGGSIPHNHIKTNIIRLLGNWIEANNLDLFVLDSDTKVRIEDFNRNLYPDALVVCEKIQYWRDRKDIITNPILLFEVLSDSTEGYDREDKFSMYRTLPSFKEYVLIDQFKPLVHDYFLHDEQQKLWSISSCNDLNASARLHSIGFDLPMEKVYWKVADLQGNAWEG